MFVLDLLQCTNEPNVSIPTLANLLLERTLNPSWVVVYKSLITIHHLMCYGNEVSPTTSSRETVCEPVLFSEIYSVFGIKQQQLPVGQLPRQDRSTR